ncbi:DUF6414 family protein [Microbacterium hydrothermale]|uniref:DUF6414 family protein n=1 Tax=Microbacterium hydrothermale TaxID=857427 RepID=UPI0022261695|nr:hypothetical protein [Microbacterium hydrothermale]
MPEQEAPRMGGDVLRNFLYLDERQLNQYISQMEDGLRRIASRSLSSEKGGGAELNAKFMKLGLNGKTADGESQEYADDGPARFERLLALVAGDEERFDWRDIEEDESLLEGMKAGHLITFGGELYESDLTKATSSTGVLGMLPLLQTIAKMPGMTGGAELDQALSGGTLEAMQGFGQAMNGKSILQGEIQDTDWRFVSLVDSAVQVEGTAYVVGKISKVWGEGDWRLLPGTPMMAQLPRAKRREIERKGPDKGAEMMWMEGPAVELEILAIYR